MNRAPAALMAAFVLGACWQGDRVLGHAVQSAPPGSGADDAPKNDGGASGSGLGGTGPGGTYETPATAGSRDGGAAGEAGAPAREPPLFGPATLIQELSDLQAVDQDPALSGDGLEIVWSSQRSGNPDLWHSRRRGLSEPWEPPQRVEELATEYAEASPYLAPDALSIWFSSDRPGGAGEHDIWVATRDARDATWTAAQPVSEVNSTASDLAPSVAGNVLVLSSARGADTYDLYLSSRSDTGSPWDQPAPIAPVNSEMSEWDPLLTQDRLELLFSSRRGASVDLYWAARASETEPFGAPQPLSSLNTEHSDHDPWWSPELGLIVFASDRSGKTALYEAHALP